MVKFRILKLALSYTPSVLKLLSPASSNFLRSENVVEFKFELVDDNNFKTEGITRKS
jgi:hypothetical protein